MKLYLKIILLNDFEMKILFFKNYLKMNLNWFYGLKYYYNIKLIL